MDLGENPGLPRGGARRVSDHCDSSEFLRQIQASRRLLERNYTRIVDGDENSNMTDQILLTYDQIKAAIAAYILKKRGISVDPSNIVITEHPAPPMQQMQEYGILIGTTYSATVTLKSENQDT
jgi:hypothetical protein